MQTSGVVLDIYDDVGGEVLRTMFPTRDDVPGFLKTAHVLSADERHRLPDDAFALVLVNGDETLRKFACIDEGNTTLSVLYFLKHAHKLPDVARQRAAENLKVACAWYGLDVPEELEKEAGLGSMALNHVAKNPVGTAMTALTAKPLIEGTSHGIRANLDAVHAGEAQGGVMGGLHAMSHKHAEVTGTSTMPISANPQKAPTPPAATVRKTAHMRPHVDVTGLEPTKTASARGAIHTALPGQYPLDSYEQVKMASAYFDEYGRRLAPAERHEYCVNLVKRASELGLELSDIIRTYGSEKYAEDETLRQALDTRRQVIDPMDKTASAILEEIYTARALVPPEDYVVLLTEFDKTAGIAHLYDRDVMDPYYSTYGFEKNASDDDFRDEVDNYFVTGPDLKKLALTPKNLMHVFGKDFVDEFRKDPVSIYKSMPTEQKKLIIRMATENSPV